MFNFFFFTLTKNLYLQKSYKNNTKNFWIPFIQISQILTFYHIFFILLQLSHLRVIADMISFPLKCFSVYFLQTKTSFYISTLQWSKSSFNTDTILLPLYRFYSDSTNCLLIYFTAKGNLWSYIVLHHRLSSLLSGTVPESFFVFHDADILEEYRQVFSRLSLHFGISDVSLWLDLGYSNFCEEYHRNGFHYPTESLVHRGHSLPEHTMDRSLGQGTSTAKFYIFYAKEREPLVHWLWNNGNCFM